MNVNPELVDDSDMPPDAQRGFRFYLTSSNSDGDRSLQATSNALEVSLGTVRTWCTRYRWVERSKKLDALANDASYEAAIVRASRLRLTIVNAYAEIAFPSSEDPATWPKTSDRLTALGKLADIAGLSRVAPPVVVHVDTTTAGYDPASLAQLSPAELLALLRGTPAPPALSPAPLPPPPAVDLP